MIPRHRRTLGVALAATLALSACADGGDAGDPTVDGADAGPSAVASATTGEAVDDEAGSTEGGDPTEVEDDASGSPAPAEATSAPAPAASEPPPAQQEPAPAGSPEAGDEQRPVPAGTYAYDTEGWRQVGEQPREDLPPLTTLTASEAGGDDLQEQVRDLRDEDGYGSRTTTTLRYGVQGVVLLGSVLESTVDVFGSPFTSIEQLEADPPVTIAPQGGGVGFHADLRLVGDDVTVEGTLDVVRREDVTIGGEVVDAFVVEVVYDLTGAIEGRATSTWWVRPADLLLLREDATTDVQSRGLRYREEQSSVLRSLTPA